MIDFASDSYLKNHLIHKGIIYDKYFNQLDRAPGAAGKDAVGP